MTAQRIRRSAPQWRDILTQFAESGLSATAFCKHNNIPYGTFVRWRNKLAKSNQKSGESVSPNDWLPIHLTDIDDEPERTWDIELHLPGGVQLRMRAI